MGFLTPDTTDEHDTLATFAQHQLQQTATTLHGLDEEQIAATPTASELSVGVLAKHVIAGARAFTALITAIGGEPLPQDAPETSALRGEDPFALAAGDSAASLTAELEATADALAAAIRGADLSAPVPTPEAEWYTGQERWTVRWLALHAVEEAARHTGHADIIREALDGAGAYELNARYDGEPWPPEEW